MGLLSWVNDIFGIKKREISLMGTAEESGFVSKELFYEILDLDTSIILFFIKEGGWVGANKAFFDTFEFEHIDDFRRSNESIREIFEEESEEIFTECDKSWLDYIRSHKQDGYGITIENRLGHERKFLAKSRMLRQNGKELYILELKDVTDLENARQQTHEIECLKSKFLANISHEFRTPMNGILGFIELLEKSKPTEKQSEYLQMIHTSARSLLSNIESLLDLAQMQSGRLEVSNSEFSPLDEMEELARIYSISGREKGISVSFFIDPKLPAFIDGDLRKIKQVLNNLVHNALKFTKRGGKVSVEVKLLRRQANQRCSIGFSVKDNGQGIAKEQLTIITQPFVTGDQADNRLGVGLSLSHGLIGLLDGKLNIQSEEGVGSTFSFALEFKASTEQAIRMLEQKTVKVALLDEKRIDDANLLTLYLRSFGFNVIKVHMIDEAVYENIEMLYLVASQEESGWMLKLGTYSKQCNATLLLEANEKLQTRMSHVIDFALCKPLVPSQFSRHFSEIELLPKTDTKMEEIQNEHANEHIKALIAEDNLINQRLIKILLQEYNIEVTAVDNGLEAVIECENNDFDIVFMDIDMPIKDGILATQEIKKQENPGQVRSMPIIALTALAMEGDREYLLEEGLDDYLSKPLTREKLEYVLQKHLKVKV